MKRKGAYPIVATLTDRPPWSPTNRPVPLTKARFSSSPTDASPYSFAKTGLQRHSPMQTSAFQPYAPQETPVSTIAALASALAKSGDRIPGLQTPVVLKITASRGVAASGTFTNFFPLYRSRSLRMSGSPAISLRSFDSWN